MKKYRYAILRSARALRDPGLLGTIGPAVRAAGSMSGEPEIRLETKELGEGDLADIASERDVVGAAIILPLTLIRPLNVSEPEGMDDARPMAPGIGWGVEAVGAAASAFTGRGISVAVLDTGIDSQHPAFSGVTVVPRNFTGVGTDQDVSDVHGHGTHCAGIAFGRDVSGQRIGVARGVERAIIGKVLGAQGGGTDSLLDAVLWALDQGAHVISMSLGIDFPGFVQELVANGMPMNVATSKALEGYRSNVELFSTLGQLVRTRGPFKQASVIVAAAGNESERTNGWRIAASPPAVSNGLVPVAALRKVATGLDVADFSNTIPLSVDGVAAPGQDILSARAGGGFVRMSGTSMATPHVAGVAALWAEMLMRSGGLASGSLQSKLLGTAVMTGLAAGLRREDVGDGLVRCP